MNRYKAGGPSKASATQLCQKCLKKGHYTYECTASKQEIPYQSRPSRTQQLLNPKFAPKLTSALPPENVTAAEKAIAKGSSKGSESARRDRDAVYPRRRGSSASSDSVSTISTNRSHSRSPSPRRALGNNKRSSPDPPASTSGGAGIRRRRTSSTGSERSRPEHQQRSQMLAETDRYSSRRESPPRRRRSRSRSPRRNPPEAERRHRRRSRSPVPSGPSRDAAVRPSRGEPTSDASKAADVQREKSLSPFSKRVALTKAGNAT